MPILSRQTNRAICASLEHKAPNCPRRELNAKDASAKPKSDAAKFKSDAAKTKSDAAKTKSDAGKARAAAKRAAAIAKSDAAKARAAAKRAADRAIIMATKTYKARQDAVHYAVYVALSVLSPMPQTAGSYKHSRWAVVADVCVRCERPPIYSVGRPKASSVLSEYMGPTKARIISTQNLGIVSL